MEIDQGEWLRRENYFLREQNKKLRKELNDAKNYINQILTKLENYKKNT